MGPDIGPDLLRVAQRHGEELRAAMGHRERRERRRVVPILRRRRARSPVDR